MWSLYKLKGTEAGQIPPWRARLGVQNVVFLWAAFTIYFNRNAINGPGMQLHFWVWGLGRLFNVTDARDRIVGVLGLTEWVFDEKALPQGLIPDYTKPIFAVFRDAFKAEIYCSENFDILDHGRLAKASLLKHESTPTWIRTRERRKER